ALLLRAPDLPYHVLSRNASGSATGKRHDAIGANVVAAILDLDVQASAWNGTDQRGVGLVPLLALPATRRHSHPPLCQTLARRRDELVLLRQAAHHVGARERLDLLRRDGR